MGWFGSTAPPEKEAKKVDEYKPLDRTERQACWEARDTYFACLDQNRILDALKDPETARRKCHREGEAFERDCAASWVGSIQIFGRARCWAVDLGRTLGKTNKG